MCILVEGDGAGIIYMLHPPYTQCQNQSILLYSPRNRRSAADLIKNHRALVLPAEDDIYSLRVRRNHILEDTLHRFRCGLPVHKFLRITFVGEPAVDEGTYTC